jgi:uncharacterized repeat protein (TIGR03806 family)
VNRLLLRHFILLAALGLGSFEYQAIAEDARPDFECRFTELPIEIDGVGDDEAWKTAQLIDHFYLPWLGEESRPARTTTRSRLLWDREHLYFMAEMQDADLFADITEHDGDIWNNDVFELFFKPAADKTGYYEFEINPQGAVLDIFIPKRDKDLRRYFKTFEFHIEAKVKLNGTLNQRDDKDDGWVVEGKIPWRDFVKTGGRPNVNERWHFALCRYDYSREFDGPELSTSAPLASKDVADFHLTEDYSILRFTGWEEKYASSQPSGNKLANIRANLSNTKSRVVGSPDPAPPYRVRRVLENLKLSLPIFVATEPGARRLWFIDQEKSYGASRLCRTSNDPQSGDFDTQLEFGDAVATSLAFHPLFTKNGYLYVGLNSKEDDTEKMSRIVRYRVDLELPNRLDLKSKREIIKWASNGHNGVAIAFGLDGMLYVTSGDGTSDSDTNLTGQGLDHLLAKVLRIDVDHPDEGRSYSVPKDNPFVGQANVRPETWAYGLRNPWRMSVDAKTGDVWVGNNGQDLWEQVYRIERGANYGWSVYEGSHPFYANRKLGPHPATKPTLEHPHSEARSLTGGIVYYGKRFPKLRGVYIYGDHSTGKIWGAKVESKKVVWHEELADTMLHITSFAADSEGELLISDHRGNNEGGFYTLEVNPPNKTAALFPTKLSESGLFASVENHRMQPGLIPYTVNSPLWSDGAYKERYLALPAADPSLEFTASRSWNFPNTTVIVKSFALEMEEGNPASRRWIETRFLTRQDDEWVGYSYRWNRQQTDATLVSRDGSDVVFEVSTEDGELRHKKWRYPSRAECMVCHSRAANFVLGLSTLQLNVEHDFGDTKVNQLHAFEQLGVLRMNWINDVKAAARAEWKKDGKTDAEIAKLLGSEKQRIPPTANLLSKRASEYPRLVDPYDIKQDLTTRARSYLHANCAQCHVGAGGGNSLMNLDFAASLDKMNVIDVVPLHNKFGINDAKLISPGQTDHSVLLHRIRTRDLGKMPPLASEDVDQRAVHLFRDWIVQMESTDAAR